MIKFKTFEFVSLLHRILWKIENAVNHFEISALVPEIFQFEKCTKYANERTDDIIHSTELNIKYINRAILVNLQQQPLKFGRLIVLQATHLLLYKILFQWQLNLFHSPQPHFITLGDFMLKKHLARPQTGSNKFKCFLDHADEVPLANIKTECQTWPAKP